ncbi:hypothetical protein [Stieleria varia]|uniref:Uncharacterized protein n=1 Tax=Stieleria varia TaxID=2528005 RepID=A0A5C5ZW03_9BACT|nr:hypothetical protein [Stieleria varia]TWT91161.1 hypothetical protein Pla52n_67030 [Stieleria varia]
MNEIDNPHDDKFNDPRVSVTRRGILIGVAILVLGVLGAIGSIYARRTRLEKSRAYWGDDTITALQLAERVELVSISGKEFEPVNLSGTPGLGHLRHSLLDERSYLWDSTKDNPVTSLSAAADSYVVELRFSDPTEHRFAERGIQLDMNDGWVGLVLAENSAAEKRIPAVEQRVQLIERVRPALRKFLETLINVQQKSYDQRN